MKQSIYYGQRVRYTSVLDISWYPTEGEPGIISYPGCQPDGSYLVIFPVSGTCFYLGQSEISVDKDAALALSSWYIAALMEGVYSA